jgi:hypothetical protein
MPNYQDLMQLISDPIDGPFEGEDFSIDQDGIIQVSDNNVRIAALLMRKANTSGKFPQNLVKIGQRGDSILLGFDTLADVEPVYVNQIGYKRDTLAEIKTEVNGKFCIYLNKKRTSKQFTKLAQARAFIKRLDKTLQQEAVEPENFED